MEKHLFIGGMVAAGFDPTGAYLLTVSHAGRGVFSTETWERIARDEGIAYPENGFAVGIGPIEGLLIPVSEIDYDSGASSFTSPDGRLILMYKEGALTVTDAGLQTS
jgi:hypothetical protein